MQLEFSTKQMATAMKAVKKMFDKGSFAEADVSLDDCLVASQNDGTAVLESASGGLYAKVTFPADVTEAGRVAISRLALHALRLQGERSTFMHTPGSRKLKFKSGSFQGELAVGEAFDAIEAARPVQIPELTISMPALLAKAASKRTCLNTTLDTVLRMRLQVSGGKMTLSCNDSFRAAAVRSKLSADAWGDGEIEVPAVFFNTVLQSIEDQQIRFGFNEKVFRICGGGFDVCHPTLQEKSEKPMADVFGKFEQLKRKAPFVVATVGTTEIRDAITAVTSVAPVGSGNEVKVELQFSDKSGGQLTTSLQSALSKGKYTIGLQSLKLGEQNTITMNAKFLLDMFGLMATDEADLYAWEQLVVLHSEKAGCCMIMPQIMS